YSGLLNVQSFKSPPNKNILLGYDNQIEREQQSWYVIQHDDGALSFKAAEVFPGDAEWWQDSDKLLDLVSCSKTQGTTLTLGAGICGTRGDSVKWMPF
ncbi:hypothetical protein, partial [Aeromonas lacus]|uniref:hypothetical protein n=1 Tax=Aeromonas lacus TaxID=558884 RepID=UPI001EE6E2C0